MNGVDVVYEKFHFRHDPKWCEDMGQPGNGELIICVACVIEMMESDSIASVRKSVALSGISRVLKDKPGALKELLLQDQRVCLHFTASLLRMLHTVVDPATLEQAMQVLVQLLLELQSEQSVQFILNEIHILLCDQSSVKGFLPTFTFLGKLLDAFPSLTQCLSSNHVGLLEQLCSVLLYPDEGLKASVFYVWQRLWGAAGVAQSLPTPLRDWLCTLLLQTLANACSPLLTVNCLGVLKELLKLSEVVSVLMNRPCDLLPSDADQSLENDQEPQSTSQAQRCPLPLILKKLLLSGDETLQVASAQCIAAVLVHSPSQYCTPFIQADVPEFLFERLSCGSEVLLWSIYSCLLLLTEEPQFFSKYHSVYGIESLVRSLKEALRLTNQEVQRQGLLLLTEVLERQPVGVHLFPSGPGFVAVAEVVLAGVSSPCLKVATQAAHAAAALLRADHQSNPVQYEELEKLVEAIMRRCSELPLPASSRRRGSLKGPEPSSQDSGAGGFVLQALVCFLAACRLAEHCSSEPGLKENVFTAPSRPSQGPDPLESMCLCLLRCCDTLCIPTVTRQCECSPSAQMLQHFFSSLSCQFSLLPSFMPSFAVKLASSGVFRFALEHKAVFCTGNRNPSLNAACCGFLQRLSVCLLSQSAPAVCIHPQDCAEMEALLQSGLPSVRCRLCDWPALLCEAPAPHCDPATPRATQYCLLTLLHLTLQYGDRLLPDSTVFSCVVTLLCSVQEQGESPPPPSVLRSAFYLLSVTQGKSPSLDRAPLQYITKALCSSPSFSSLYTHHPPLLHFIFHYPELANHFGPQVLELWLSHRPEATPQSDTHSKKIEQGQEADPDVTHLQALLEKNPSVILTLLGMVCTREAPLAERALEVLEGFLHSRRGCEANLEALLRPTLLQVLQQVNLESSQGTGVGGSLPVVLRLLCLMQTSSSPENHMDGIHFKLLYQVSNLAAKLKASDTECLLPAFSYLYCSLHLAPQHCTHTAVSMLLCNTGLMDQLQATLHLASPSPSLSGPSALLCCSHLLLSSLITLQHAHAAQVHRSISLDVDSVVHALFFRKKTTDSLLLASSLRLLQAVLDVDLESPVLCVGGGPSAGKRPLGETDSSLYPLGSHRAHCLITALYGLLLQKQELLLNVTVNCLGSLLGFLQRRSQSTAQHVVCQPWTRFLLDTLLNSGDSCMLHPATLSLLTLLFRYDSGVLRDPDLSQVLDAVERRGLKELGANTAQALRQLFTQLQCGVICPPPTENNRLRAKTLMKSLSSLPLTSIDNLPTSIMRVGELSVCLSDFTVKTPGHPGSQS
ncbi:meiosis inhibitor protein 1 isoform X1 [Esox lucius]|uniref:meiosis inhibitor protein 1 isoform X1 n=1 Tax=Esox lucius TaxID=8010 RepID=UPI00147775C8|nr:meiosis inhibitor protein 1 isoform X1 [Esox lucius]